MRLTYHPLAETEAVAATRYYESQLTGLGRDFRAELDTAIHSILTDPLRLALIDEETRMYLMKRFPFGVYYRVEEDTVRILVIKHHRQHPDVWTGRD